MSWVEVLTVVALVAALLLVATTLRGSVRGRTTSELAWRRWLGVGLALVLSGQLLALRTEASLLALVVVVTGIVAVLVGARSAVQRGL